MSIKLYNSYKLPKMTQGEFFALIPVLRKEVRAKQESKFKEKFLKECLELFDHKTLYPDSHVTFTKMYSTGTHSASSIIREKLSVEQKERKANGNMDDFYFHADFMFYHGRYYCVTHEMPNSDYHKSIKKVLKAELFEYWDNTDEPKGMTRAQWQSRRNTWEKAFGSKSWDTQDPRCNAVRVEFEFRIGYRVHDLIKGAKLSKSLLSDKERVRVFAENNVMNEWSNNVAPYPDENKDLKLNTLLDEEKASKDKFDQMWRYSFTDEYREKRSKEAVRLQSVLKMNVSAKDILDAEYEVTKDLDQAPKGNKNYTVHLDTF